MKFNNRAFSIVEIIVAMFVLGIFSALMTQMVAQQGNMKKTAEVKTAMHTLLVQAQNATKRFELLQLDTLFASRGNDLNNCFKGRGLNCEDQNTGRPEFPDPEMNALLRGEYRLDGVRCAAGENCPIKVNTEWVFTCQPSICTNIRFLNSVTLDPALAPDSSLIPLLSAIPAISAESDYSAHQSIGLIKTLSSNCNSATGVNFATGLVECAPQDPNNTNNQLFSSKLGFNFQNTDSRLMASDSSGSSSSATTCPSGTVAKMQNGVIVCNREPTLLCTNPGWIIKRGKCCNPTMPGGNNGWGSWSGCSSVCGGGSQSRSCQYANNTYCDSACSAGQSGTQACNTQACPPPPPEWIYPGGGWAYGGTGVYLFQQPVSRIQLYGPNGWYDVTGFWFWSYANAVWPNWWIYRGGTPLSPATAAYYAECFAPFGVWTYSELCRRHSYRAKP